MSVQIFFFSDTVAVLMNPQNFAQVMMQFYHQEQDKRMKKKSNQ